MHIGLAVHRNATRDPEAQAIFGDKPQTYGELESRSNQIANYLKSYNWGKGERVAVLLPNRPEIPELITAISKSSLVYVGLNFRLGRAEMMQIFENCEPCAILTDEEHLPQIEQLADESSIPVFDISSSEWEARIGESSKVIPSSFYDIKPDDDFCIVYTSGTTGRPKGVLFDHKRVLQHAMIACLEYDITPKSRYLIQIPHNSSVNITILPCVTVGAALGFADSRNFNPLNFAQQINDHAVTHTFLVPTQLMRLLEKLPEEDDKNLSTLVTLGYGSSPISPKRLEELVARFGPIFNQLYGMAEIASIGTILSKADHLKGLSTNLKLLESCGRPSYGVHVRVVDENKRSIEAGGRGEVVFSGPHVMKGYFRDPERTDQVLIDGWMHSGDIAEVDNDGFIYIVDRKKNLIIRGGLNIAPTEIENVLYRHPDVLEASVVGVPDSEWGEGIVAVVALNEESEVTSNELLQLCNRSELTSIKMPERIDIWDELPKNAVGKIAKNEIRAHFWGEGRQV